jgi:hypothetical protein
MNNPYAQFINNRGVAANNNSGGCSGVAACGGVARGNANAVNYQLAGFLNNCSTSQCTANLNELIANGSTDTVFADLVKTAIVCALTECDDDVQNPFSPDLLCQTAHTTYWTYMTQLGGGAGQVSFRFPKAGDYLLEVIAVMSTPAIALTEIAALCGYRIAFCRNVGACVLNNNLNIRFTVNNVDLIKFDYHYIIAYWNFALTEGKFKAYRFCVGDVPTLTAPQIALQPYILTVPLPFYFANANTDTPCRAFPLVSAGFSDLQINITIGVTWADVLIVYKLPITIEAQCVLMQRYGLVPMNGAALDGLIQGNNFVTAENLGLPAQLIQNIFATCGVDAASANIGLGNLAGNIGLCFQDLATGFISPLDNAAVAESISRCGMNLPAVAVNDADNFDGVCPCPLLNTSQLPLGCGVIPRTARNRGRFIPQALWKPFLNNVNARITTNCLFTNPSCLAEQPVVQMAALYGVVTNALRVAIQGCVIDYAIQSVQTAVGSSATQGICGDAMSAGMNNGGNYNSIQLTFLYAVTTILYMAENLTSKLFGIHGNYSGNVLSYSGPDPIYGMQLNYESNTRWSGNPEILTRLEAFSKAPRYPRSLYDARLIGNAFTGQLEGTPNYFDILDDINGLNFLSYGMTPFEGCVAGGIVDYGTITVTFNTKLRSLNSNCAFVQSNGGVDNVCSGVNIPALPEFFPFDPSTCMPATFLVRLYAISWQILRFEVGQLGWAIL